MESYCRTGEGPERFDSSLNSIRGPGTGTGTDTGTDTGTCTCTCTGTSTGTGTGTGTGTDLFTFLVWDLDRDGVTGLVGHTVTVGDGHLMALLVGDLNNTDT